MPDYLYHGTGVYCLAAIAESNLLLEGVHWGRPGEPHGPRLTRKFEVAREFIRYNMHFGEGGILVLDKELLLEDFEVVPYTDVDCVGKPRNEEEEVILAPVVPISKCISNIVCHPVIIQEALDQGNMQDAMEEGGWPWEDGEAGICSAQKALSSLLLHPKLNRSPLPWPFPLHGNWRQA